MYCMVGHTSSKELMVTLSNLPVVTSQGLPKEGTALSTESLWGHMVSFMTFNKRGQIIVKLRVWGLMWGFQFLPYSCAYTCMYTGIKELVLSLSTQNRVISTSRNISKWSIITIMIMSNWQKHWWTSASYDLIRCTYGHKCYVILLGFCLATCTCRYAVCCTYML